MAEDVTLTEEEWMALFPEEADAFRQISAEVGRNYLMETRPRRIEAVIASRVAAEREVLERAVQAIEALALEAAQDEADARDNGDAKLHRDAVIAKGAYTECLLIVRDPLAPEGRRVMDEPTTGCIACTGEPVALVLDSTAASSHLRPHARAEPRPRNPSRSKPGSAPSTRSDP